MRLRTINKAAFVLLLAGCAHLNLVWAQAPAVSASKEIMPEPEFADVFFRLDTGKLIPLERQTATMQGRAGGFIVVSVKASWEIPGANSPVRFRSGRPLDFVVRTALDPSGADPATLYFLSKLDVKNKTRELVVMEGHASPGGATMNGNPAQSALPVTFSRYGDSSLKLTTGPLPPGEYALSGPYVQPIFCFGVD
ncbi:MAG: hypothetical protein ABSF70_06360 [Terracidiphilus sp.]|jgi:hypothetical protein